jgi:hypothetical protein
LPEAYQGTEEIEGILTMKLFIWSKEEDLEAFDLFIIISIIIGTACVFTLFYDVTSKAAIDLTKACTCYVCK